MLRVTDILHYTLLLWAVVAMLATWPDIGSAQELTADEARAIAREAYIYGAPIVESYKMMYAFAIDTDGKQYEAPFNTLKHQDYELKLGGETVVTPNIAIAYSFLWIDLRTQPLVLGVPEIEDDRYYSIQLTDFYKFTFDYIGSRATGNAAGRYLIAGPSWTGETPPNIDKVIRCETDFAMAVYRTQQRGPEDGETVEKIRSGYTVETLSEFLSQPAPEPAAAIDFPEPQSEAEPSLTFFSTLNFVLQFCPPHPSEQELMARLARIGVIAGAPFGTSGMSAEIQESLAAGMREGEAAITAATVTLKAAEVVGTRDDLGNDYVKRAVAAKLGRFANSKEEALDTLYRTDAEGKPLDASDARYVLRLNSENLPPVNAFWSLTLYDGQSNSLVSNALGRYRISSSMTSTLARDADGGLTLYVQQRFPAEEQLSNLLPAPNGPFYMVMRLYWPKPEAYDGTWTPPLVWRAEATPTVSVPKPAGAEAAEEVKPSVLVDEPKLELERPSIWGEPTEVQIAIYVIDVDEINSADQSFAASVYYVAQWKNPFLRHKGPGPMHRGLTDVWNPRLAIIGQQMQWKSYPDSVEIQPDGKVIYRQKAWARFSQPLQLRDFPFDRQELSIHMVAAGLLERDVKLVSLAAKHGRTSGIAKSFSLPDFDVVSWKSEPRPYIPVEGEVGAAGYEMRIEVVRQAAYYVLKVIIPLSLIVIMSWLPR
jgi:hypothetical protein